MVTFDCPCCSGPVPFDDRAAVARCDDCALEFELDPPAIADPIVAVAA